MLLTAIAFCVSVGCSDAPTCCLDNYPPSYALLYGTVRGASGRPAEGVLVQAGEVAGVRTDGGGRYRLPTVVHGVGGATLVWPVKAYRTDPSRGLVDSSSVSASIPFFASDPPRDSARVDLVAPWVP
jgi:hypothetical protein